MPSLPRRRGRLLELDLTTVPIEVEPEDVVGRLRSRHRPRLTALLRALHEAGDDPSVRGLLVKVGGSALPWATVQEIRSGLVAFARSGKPSTAWAETLGEGGSGTADYVLATACGQVWLQPSAELALVGVASETTFLRGALDKLGVEPQLDKRHEYKNAADRIMRTEFTPEHREAVDRLAASAWEGAVTTVAAARGLSVDDVRSVAERAPLSAAEARDAGLVDRIGYRDEVYAEMRKQVGDDAQLLYADQWTPRRSVGTLLARQRDFVAVVDGHGEIVPGRTRQGPRGRQLGSDTVSAALRAARDDEHAKAVLFRVDSPGGSAVASDTIWREVTLVRDAGKPVIVSMGAVAGSGGYYIACPADVIVAQPATITGSIGVLGGKIVVTGLLDRLGLGTGAVEHGGAARMFSSRRGFTDDEQQRLAAMLDRIYADFVQKVADGRGLTRDAADAVARGRVWSGADAAGNGLVDVLGGMRDAARLARERAGLPADAPLRPALHVPPLARLGRARSSEDPRALARVTLSPWGDLAALAAELGLPGGGPLRMPGIRLR
ncbi:protease-4 [Jatrophihabitans endophyticus]|uniref:Protease-4 n=1 Tax=Jatrophihabitans endophyticus TaxID=1206085 RepID=A0A1M5K651_9ACTN|nr:signal peptide peptidase SppA [Jatrophihabitans endophyticus]SHG48266.1 protease-4 [Jatrophihabitans endophyticus]